MKSSKYSDLDIYLHQQFLGNSDLSNFLFNRIKGYKNKENKIFKIFITGLARSGTTAMLNKIYLENKIASITYKNMPFVLSPSLSNIFAKLSQKNKKISSKSERIHGDGIQISIDSPECLDEPFWIKENANYFNEKLNTNKIYKREILEAYENFLNKHSTYQKRDKILIKNNNNHVRLKQLCNFFKNDIFIVLYRDPLSQSYSLQNTHNKIIKSQNDDEFVTKYMNLIGHREFGLNQMPFKYKNQKYNLKKISDTHDSINYWLQTWINAYSWIYEFIKSNIRNNVFLISYEEVCTPNNKKLSSIINRAKLNLDNKFILKNKNFYKKNKMIDKYLLEEANLIYKNLRSLN